MTTLPTYDEFFKMPYEERVKFNETLSDEDSMKMTKQHYHELDDKRKKLQDELFYLEMDMHNLDWSLRMMTTDGDVDFTDKRTI